MKSVHDYNLKLEHIKRKYSILSCQQNIIVALIWFLCPTVTLCEQHLISINRHIPPMYSRCFTSNDNIDHWKAKKIWDAATLQGVRVAVSTYQVLFDALSHGFVQIDWLSLLIFDEAEGLQKFRTGHLNLIVAMDALEEGVDVPACNTVVSFDRPVNLKSFIQRRGRARQKDSVFISIVGNTDSEIALRKFQGDEKSSLRYTRTRAEE
ncbi:hypothetical protein BDW75DRAFT_233236 [Aspergillus navahoensis]